MANLKEVKGRIQSVASIQQITKAMKMVAAAKLRRAQDRLICLRPYAQKLSKIIKNISEEYTEEMDNPYSIKRSVEKVLLVVICSDRGLCGGFNSNVLKTARLLISDKYSGAEANGNVEILPVGKKALEFFKKRKYKVIDTYASLLDGLNFVEVKKVVEMIMEKFSKEEYDRVDIIYNEFKNIATQIIRTEQFLPIKEACLEEDKKSSFSLDYLCEPSKDFIMDELMIKSLKVQFHKMLLESNVSEHGARMTAMDKATENANELLKELRLSYNRTRQAAITTEILEIVGGAEALVQA